MIRKLEFEEINLTRPKSSEIDQIKRFPILVMAENIRSLYNVGSIFRSSDGAGIERLYLGGYTGCPPRKEISKTALGSTMSVPWEYSPDPVLKISELKKQGYFIVVLEHTDNSENYIQADYTFPLCLIIGNEVDGVSQELCSLADMAIEIPMHGIKQSLNVSVAYGILVYQLVNKYKEKIL